MKKVAILQSNYIPWKGYFDIINYVDEFVIFDDVQYTRRDWRNRNQIKSSNGTSWLTIPVKTKGKYLQKINETAVSCCDWQHKHLTAIKHNYKNALYYKEVMDFLEPLYKSNYSMLSEINHSFIVEICDYLAINTNISWSTEYRLQEGKNERLLSITKEANGTAYVSGRAASYINPQLFQYNNVELIWFDYRQYEKYNQLWGNFVHEVSIIDTLFNCGKSTIEYLRGPEV